MGGGSGSSRTTTSTKVDLPKWYEGYAQDIAGQAYDQSQKPYQAYGGDRIAPMNDQQMQGLDLVAGLGANNPLTGAANTNATDTLSGKYLDPTTNPAWAPGVEKIGQSYRDIISPTTNALFSKGNAFGVDNSAYQQYTGQQQRQVGDAISGLWGDLYNQERGRQTTTLGLAPSLNQSTYADYQNLIGSGDALRSYQQDLLNLNYNDWLEKQQYPWTQIQNFAGIAPSLIGNSGGTTTTGPNPNKASPIAGAAGGAALAGGAAAAIPAVAATGYGIPIAVLLGALAGGALSS